METNILSAIRDRNIFWIVIFYYLYYKAPNISSVPGSITMRDFKNNCFKKEFSLISTEKKAIVDILFFGIILRCGYCPFRFHGCFYCYVMLVVFWSLKRGRKYFRNHHNTRSTNNDLKLIFWKKKTLCKRLCEYYILCHSETEDRQDVRFGNFPPVLNVLLLLIKVVVHQQQQQNLWWIHHRRRLLLWFRPKKGWVWNINSQSCQDR